MQEILPLNSSSYHAHIYIFFFRLAGKYGCRCTDNANTAEPAPQPSPPDFPQGLAFLFLSPAWLFPFPLRNHIYAFAIFAKDM